MQLKQEIAERTEFWQCTVFSVFSRSNRVSLSGRI